MLFLLATESLDFPPSQKHFKPEMFTDIIPAAPANADSPIVCAKLGVFMPWQSHFKEKIFKYVIPTPPCQCRFAISCAKLGVFMPCQSHTK
jgi:hypothetical protein